MTGGAHPARLFPFALLLLLGACATATVSGGGATGTGGTGTGGTGGVGSGGVNVSYWDWQLTEPFYLDRTLQVFDLDPDSVTAAQVAAINARGTKTVCYVSVGTLENYRSDVNSFPASVIGKTYGNWPDERFLDIRNTAVLLPLMQARFQKCKDMGFAAIEPDNMDVYTNNSGFAITKADTINYVLKLADIAHGMGLEIAQKNVPELTPLLVSSLDFAITESCYQDGWCNAVTGYTAQGKDILDAEYNDRPIDFPVACGYAANNTIKMILKNRNLTAPLQTCS